MTRYEQIEEMAKMMFGHICTRTKCDSCKYPNKQKDCEAYTKAEALYNAGYRKGDEEVLYRDGTTVLLSGERYYKLHEIELNGVKGTAEEIYIKLMQEIAELEQFYIRASIPNKDINLVTLNGAKKIVRRVLKEYGVEVEE